MSAGTLRAPWGSCAREPISSAGNTTGSVCNSMDDICSAAYTQIIYSKSLHSSFQERHVCQAPENEIIIQICFVLFV